MLPLAQHRRLRQAVTVLLLAGALACMFPPDNALFRYWAAHPVWVSVGYLALGMALLALKRTRLMFVSLGCSAAVSFYANETALNRRREAAERSGTVKIVCLYNPTGPPAETVSHLLQHGVDAVVLVARPGATDTATLDALQRHWPARAKAPGATADSLRYVLYSRLPLLPDSTRTLPDGGLRLCLRPEFAGQYLSVVLATTANVPAPTRSTLAVAQRPHTPDAGWLDSDLCQRTDDKGVKYPFAFAILHTPDLDCVQSEMVRVHQRYVGYESVFRLPYEPQKPL